ncbi:MAG: ABC transporter ATP-binding protein [Candidatus Enteromonas sp.]
MPEIVLTNITKSWPRAGGKKGERTVGVDNLNLTIKDRGFITLLGPSGCGKTTTLRMIAGLETPTSGKITIGGKVVFDSEKGINISPDKRNVGFLFQNYALWPHMTVYKNIAFGLENMKWKKEDIKARVTELLAMLKIDELGDRYPSELSGGQQQRVAIARTLAPKPSVLFMDEPLSNLDAKLRLEMRTELKRLHRDTESTFVYVTHDQLEAMTLATEVCLMEKGVLQQYDPPLEVYAKPNNLFVADFVGNPTMNFLRGQVINREGNKAQIKFGETLVEFEANDNFDLSEINEQVVLGVRPEFVVSGTSKGRKAEVIASLPSGMETTLKVKIDETILTSVVFGIVDYPVGEKITINFTDNHIVLFDGVTTKRICDGKLVFVK